MKKNPEQELVLLKLKLEAKELECDLQGEMIATLQKQVKEMLALQEMRLKALEGRREPEILKDMRKAL